MMDYAEALTLGLLAVAVVMIAALWRLFDVFPIPWKWRDAFWAWCYLARDWVRRQVERLRR